MSESMKMKLEIKLLKKKEKSGKRKEFNWSTITKRIKKFLINKSINWRKLFWKKNHKKKVLLNRLSKLFRIVPYLTIAHISSKLKNSRNKLSSKMKMRNFWKIRLINLIENVENSESSTRNCICRMKWPSMKLSCSGRQFLRRNLRNCKNFIRKRSNTLKPKEMIRKVWIQTYKTR